jgi:hypothetical protein
MVHFSNNSFCNILEREVKDSPSSQVEKPWCGVSPWSQVGVCHRSAQKHSVAPSCPDHASYLLFLPPRHSHWQQCLSVMPLITLGFSKKERRNENLKLRGKGKGCDSDTVRVPVSLFLPPLRLPGPWDDVSVHSCFGAFCHPCPYSSISTPPSPITLPHTSPYLVLLPHKPFYLFLHLTQSAPP